MFETPFGYPDDIPADSTAFPPGPCPSGLLPPKYPAGTVCGFVSDHPEAVEIIPEEDLDAYIVDEDEDDAPPEAWVNIKSQDGAGSCATESVTLGEETIEQVQGNKCVELNPWFMFFHTKSSYNGGSSHDENLAFLRSRGVAPMSVWPRSMGWGRRPSEEAYEAAKAHRGREFLQARSVLEVKCALVARKPVILGWPGHSILGMRLRKGQRKIKIANSWDVTWGNRGFGDMSISDIVWGYGVYVPLTSTRYPL